MTENTTPGSNPAEDAETMASETEHQEQQEQRFQTEERLSMDPTDFSDAIDQERDQKFDGDDETRYEDEVDQALRNDGR